MARVTGIGGVFFLSQGEGKTLSSWYQEHLGMQAMLKQLTAAGIDLQQGPEYHENGVFAWIMDPEGNKVELWEPKIWDDKNKK